MKADAWLPRFENAYEKCAFLDHGSQTWVRTLKRPWSEQPNLKPHLQNWVALLRSAPSNLFLPLRNIHNDSDGLHFQFTFPGRPTSFQEWMADGTKRPTTILAVLLKCAETVFWLKQHNLYHCGIGPDCLVFDSRDDVWLLGETLPFFRKLPLDDQSVWSHQAYRAPELGQDPTQIQVNSELYSLGVMACHMLMGQNPILRARYLLKSPQDEGQILHQCLMELAPDYRGLLRAWLQTDPQQRPDWLTAISSLKKALDRPSLVPSAILLTDKKTKQKSLAPIAFLALLAAQMAVLPLFKLDKPQVIPQMISAEFSVGPLEKKLFEAAHNQDIYAVMELEEQGANLEVLVADQSLYDIALANDDNNLLLFLLRNKVQLGLPRCLLQAVEKPDTLSLLLESGVPPNLKDFQGTTPLTYAIRYGNPSVVRTLLNHGARKADVQFEDQDWQTLVADEENLGGFSEVQNNYREIRALLEQSP